MNMSALQSWGRNLSKLKSYSEKPWFYPAALLLIGLVAYGYQLGLLGYYWDDWEVVFLLHSRSLPLLYGYFAFDRPFAWPYQVMYALVGLQPVAWHLVTLLLRWGGTLLFYLSLKQIWPRYDSTLRWLGVLLLLYPGFFQQSISTAYKRHFTAFFLFMLVGLPDGAGRQASEQAPGSFSRFPGSPPSSRSLQSNTLWVWNSSGR